MSLKSVMAKVAGIEKEKIELATERVELGLIEDLKKAEQTLNVRLMEFDEQINNAQQYINYAINSRKDAQKQFENYSTIVLKGRSASKELGIDFPYENDYKSLQKKLVDVNAKFLKVIGNK
jgi:hypothetical protein